jgi:hypothetical protein
MTPRRCNPAGAQILAITAKGEKTLSLPDNGR